MSILAAIASALLLIPKTGDPTVQPPEVEKEGYDAINMPAMFFGGEGVTSVTYATWLRWEPFAYVTNGTLTGMSPAVFCDCSYQTARSTTEGGDTLPNLIDDAYLTNGLPLSASGEWSTNCLPAVGNLAPATLRNWQFGCYVVNYTSDAAFTLTVGSNTMSCAASATNVIFNMLATSTNRYVTVKAADANANVKFGIAHNPLVQFIGGWSANNDDIGKVYPNMGGLMTNEWRMVVFRSRIDGGTNMITNTEMWRPTTKCTYTHISTQQMWKAANNFADNSRVRCSINYCIGTGMAHTNGNEIIHWYAPKGNAYWMTDDEVQLWRDKDYQEIQRRGM